jgi:hypothetical protein
LTKTDDTLQTRDKQVARSIVNRIE